VGRVRLVEHDRQPEPLERRERDPPLAHDHPGDPAARLEPAAVVAARRGTATQVDGQVAGRAHDRVGDR
jgi:hypothetical protein